MYWRTNRYDGDNILLLDERDLIKSLSDTKSDLIIEITDSSDNYLPQVLKYAKKLLNRYMIMVMAMVAITLWSNW